AAEPRVDARAPRTRDELGRVTVVGGSVDDANQVAASMLPSFRRCKLRWSPKSTGEVQVAAKIGPVGEVRIATPEGGDPLPPMLVACVRAKVASAKFAPPTGSDPTVVIPIRFSAD
ncbi:MAG TPA: energy transducer TonB, partial [Minicystis sp.]|nr:energy transducer TonB [Minicystis sp.]